MSMPRKPSITRATSTSRAAIVAALLLFAGFAAVKWAGGKLSDAAAPVVAGPRASQPDPGVATGKGSEARPLADRQLVIETAGGPRPFTIEIADTPELQAQGLMFRTKLADGAGMLFPHDAPRELSMWMRNTYIPLDMVFIRADGVVHRIAANTEPLSEAVIGSGGPVVAVLEIAGGSAARLGIRPGDRVRHAHFATAVAN